MISLSPNIIWNWSQDHLARKMLRWLIEEKNQLCKNKEQKKKKKKNVQ